MGGSNITDRSRLFTYWSAASVLRPILLVTSSSCCLFWSVRHLTCLASVYITYLFSFNRVIRCCLFGWVRLANLVATGWSDHIETVNSLHTIYCC